MRVDYPQLTDRNNKMKCDMSDSGKFCIMLTLKSQLSFCEGDGGGLYLSVERLVVAEVKIICNVIG